MSNLSQEDSWNSTAKHYHYLIGQVTCHHAAEALRRLRLVPTDSVVLDIACGTGAFALPAARQLKQVAAGDTPTAKKVIATDFAKAMVVACREAAAKEGLSEWVECVQMDAEVPLSSHGWMDGWMDSHQSEGNGA